MDIMRRFIRDRHDNGRAALGMHPKIGRESLIFGYYMKALHAP